MVVTWGPVDLKEPHDGRFTVRSFGSRSDPQWKAYQDWNWYPDVDFLPSLISDDGMYVIFPRFDEHWMEVMGHPFPYEVRRVDPVFAEMVYEQTWQVAVDHKDEINLLVLYHWNEHQEHSAIEPENGESVTGYGHALVDKTATYYHQFHLGQAIDISPLDSSGLWGTPKELQQFIGNLDASELGLNPGTSIERFLTDRLRESQSLIQVRLGRDFLADDVPAGLKNIHLRLTANIYNYILMNKRNPVMQVGEFNFQLNDDSVFTEALKNDLAPFRRRRGMQVLYP